MYNIERNAEYLVVNFEADFDLPMMQAIIHHETMLTEYPYTNDIWHIGPHHADIRLSGLETMVRDFHCRCPSDATRTKTALVVEDGQTQAILELWVSAMKKRVTFEIQMFQSLEEAENWLEVAKEQVA